MTWPASLPTFTAGLVAPEADLDALTDALHAIGDAWASYVPIFQSGTWTLNNGTLTGRASLAGKLVHAMFDYTVGSTDTPSGALIISLPAVPNLPTNAPLGTAYLLDSSGSTINYRRVVYAGSSGGVGYARFRDDSGTSVIDTVPWTWATGDRLIASAITYEAV